MECSTTYSHFSALYKKNVFYHSQHEAISKYLRNIISPLNLRLEFGYVTHNPAGGGGGGTPIWNRRGCSSEILNLTPKGDHLGAAQAFCDP